MNFSILFMALAFLWVLDCFTVFEFLCLVALIAILEVLAGIRNAVIQHK